MQHGCQLATVSNPVVEDEQNTGSICGATSQFILLCHDLGRLHAVPPRPPFDPIAERISNLELTLAQDVHATDPSHARAVQGRKQSMLLIGNYRNGALADRKVVLGFCFDCLA